MYDSEPDDLWYVLNAYGFVIAAVVGVILTIATTVWVVFF